MTVFRTDPAGLQAAAAAADGQDAALQPGLVTAADFAAAMQRVGPSIVRGAAVEVSPVSWDDVGGYAGVKQRLRQAVEWPLQHAGGLEGGGGADLKSGQSVRCPAAVERGSCVRAFEPDAQHVCAIRCQCARSFCLEAGLQSGVTELCCMFVLAVCAESFKRLGLSPPRGVLLHGPPGCSKTMLARAAATGSKATFIPLSCAQVGRELPGKRSMPETSLHFAHASTSRALRLQTAAQHCLYTLIAFEITCERAACIWMWCWVWMSTTTACCLLLWCSCTACMWVRVRQC